MTKLMRYSLLAAALLLAGCATQMPDTIQPQAPGFWMGFWHGITVFFSFVWSLFDSSVSIFSTPNNGGWYAFGFVLGVGGLGKGVDLLILIVISLFGDPS